MRIMDKNLNGVVTANLIRLRLENDYSQQKIANILKISQPSYNRIESGKTQLSLVFSYRLSRFYNVLIDDLATPRSST